ncbi:MAG: DNA polymerase III subunit alpha, partial [Flavobacterium sp.]|nr:DNA polymerase III subunit alpha [Flavobacterium sp.]
LKAHYPAEYMAAVLSNNMNDIKQVSFFMEECKRMGLKVLGPDVNESYYKFTVNEDYAVRFGMGAIKGVGQGAVDTIVENRKDGKYKSIFDLAKRIDLRAANKKAFENLALAGGFDGFGDTHRAQYFHDEGDGITFLEKAMRYGSKFQENENSAQVSLFGDASEVQIPEPVVPPCEEWSTMEKLAKEKEVVGIYISGHPLDDYKYEMKYFCNTKLEHLNDLNPFIGKNVSVGGIITKVEHRTAKNGKGWGMFTLEGYDESYEFRIFGEEYLKFRHFLIQNNFTFLKFVVKEGWVNAEGKRSDPKIQFLDVKMLQDVLPSFAKKLVLQFNITELSENLIQSLFDLFQKEKGDHQVTIEVLELEKVMKQVVSEATVETLETEGYEENIEVEVEPMVTEVEQVQVVTKLSMPSRKMKIKISNELLQELENRQINFKLN